MSVSLFITLSWLVCPTLSILHGCKEEKKQKTTKTQSVVGYLQLPKADGDGVSND